MSILIKGMKMPKNCRTCKLIDYDRGCYRCIVTTAPCDLNSKNENCPLVPVPPHGRLIDVDVLMKHKGNCYDADGHLLYAVGTGNILCAPTIIEAEEGE